MARTTRPLTHTEVQKAKALEKDLTLHDGDGLFLLVKTTGKKLWRFRYLRPGTSSRTMVSLGAYPALSLADARQIRAEKPGRDQLHFLPLLKSNPRALSRTHQI